MIAIEGIPRSMYHGPMLANYSQGAFPPSLNGDLQHPGFHFGEQKHSGISQPNTFSPSATIYGTDKQQQLWKEALKQRKEYSTFKKVIVLLQDNTLKTGDPKTAEKLRELNRSQSDSCPQLKKFLNILLVSTAVILLVAVIIVIIYTSVKNPAMTHQQTDIIFKEALQPSLSSPSTSQFSSISSPPTSSSSSSPPSKLDLPPDGDETKIFHGDFKPRTELRPPTTKCRMVAMVTEEGAIRLKQLCFQVGSMESP